MHQIFGVNTCKLTLVQNFSALPGAQHLERRFASTYVSHMACRDGDSPSRRAILHRPGQNVKISGPNIFVPKFWKIGHNSELARWNLLSVVAFQAKTPRIEILQARGLGKFCSSRMR